jgi:putative methyltransferase (TIGR04325 family)
MSRQAPQIGDPIALPNFLSVESSTELSQAFDSNTFNQKEWLDTVEFATEKLLNLYANNQLTSNAHLYPLTGLLSSLAEFSEQVTVADFGGGYGDNFLRLACALNHNVLDRLRYNVIETDLLISKFSNFKIGRNALDPVSLFNIDDLQSPSSKHRFFPCHLLLLTGSLQYAENWTQTLTDLLKTGPDFVYICRTIFNDQLPSFGCCQDVSPSDGPWQGLFIGRTGVHIFNSVEVIHLFSRLGYEAVSNEIAQDYSEQLKGLAKLEREGVYRNILLQKV